ncbi:MAG: hypothetical protein Edafosvirus31_4 [Edafosvirus sp.]|uniref:Uncharacterized protein n=1 Tax=Edafosvirus sp. TaxID=2487765 RepID=A0A3G4ZWN3_9VIRU|nr:MAG: hypothetical protein Edafosvirus31_4 [Edafosvirus sp.]
MEQYKIQKYLNKLKNPDITQNQKDMYISKLEHYFSKYGQNIKQNIGQNFDNIVRVPITEITLPEPQMPRLSPTISFPMTVQSPVMQMRPTNITAPATTWEELQSRYELGLDSHLGRLLQSMGYQPYDFTLPNLVDSLDMKGLSNDQINKIRNANIAEQELAINYLTANSYAGPGWKPITKIDELPRRYTMDKVLFQQLEPVMRNNSSLMVQKPTDTIKLLPGLTPPQIFHVKVLTTPEQTLMKFLSKQTNKEIEWKPTNNVNEWFRLHNLENILNENPIIMSPEPLYKQLRNYSDRLPSQIYKRKIDDAIEEDRILLPIFYVNTISANR